MARSRSVPTNLFENPDFFERSSETQVILLGLLLDADDAGRGLAHPGLLARKFNKEVASIETALAELQSCEMLDCYQVGRHTYYSLRHWQQWQTLSKPTPSKFPAPPSLDEPSSAVPNQACPASIQLPQGNPGEIGETLSEGEEEREVEEEGKLKRSEGEGVASQPGNVIPFPIPTASGTGSALSPLSQEALAALTSQVAAILKLPVTPALQRVVQDYGTNRALSLLGEADAAREWMDRQGRSRKGLSMSPAFFRRWLKREVEEHESRQIPQQRATGTTSAAPSSSPLHRFHTEPAGTPSSGEEDQYQAHLQRRVQAVQAAHAGHIHQGG